MSVAIDADPNNRGSFPEDAPILLDPTELLDALSAVRDALDVPHGATVGDQETRNAILVERTVHATVMLSGIFDRIGDGSNPDIAWSAGYLREQLAKIPADGYRTWPELAAVLKATLPDEHPRQEDRARRGYPRRALRISALFRRHVFRCLGPGPYFPNVGITTTG